MLIRAYRLTDKFGVVGLKLSLAMVDITLDGLGVIWRALVQVLLLVFGVLRVVLGWIIRPLWALLRFLARLVGLSVNSAETAASGAMARRAARTALRTEVTEDPLRAQNRLLSVLTVLLLVALIGVVLWATNPSRSGVPPTSPGIEPGASVLFASTQQAPTQALLSTPVPTATPLPSVLEVRGSLAYTVREQGQTDIWVVPVGSRAPIRLTNDPADERDPAWDPDGRRIAYASRQDGNWELYIYDVMADSATRMTYDLSFQGAPGWSPDGEWLIYESYQGNNLDIYLMRVDGSESPIRLPGNSDAPDFSPAWSPDGRRIAFVSWRDGNQDIYIFSLDDQTTINVTNTPDRHEDYPAWSPDGSLLTYSALDEGLEKVFVKSALDPNAAAQVQDRGRMPAWSPDGASLVFAVDSVDGTQMIASPFSGVGVVTTIIPVPRGAGSPSWTSAPLPGALVNAGGVGPAITSPLFIEQEDRRESDPPYRLNSLQGVSTENAVLSDRVNDSFNALRERTLEMVGYDFLGRLDDAFWRIDRPPQPGEERRNWLMTGRAFSITRGAIAGFPAPVEVVREDIGVETYWRIYVRVSEDAQSGQLGEPLRAMPWDFASRTQGDVEAYDQGGRLRVSMPTGYYVDFTALAESYGWSRVPAGRDWRANSNSINFWLFRKSEGLGWYEAMREIYTEAQLGGFVPTATPAPPGSPTPEGAPAESPPAIEEPTQTQGTG